MDFMGFARRSSFAVGDRRGVDLAGRAMSGFEFVSNFAPASGDVFFNLDKTRTTAPSSWSVCYLAPKSVQWSCSQPAVADAGTYWQLSVQRPKVGVYVLTAPN